MSTRPLYEGWLNLLMVRLRAADGVEFERHVVEMRRAVAVLPFDPDRRVALTVSMPRTPVMLAGLPDMMRISNVRLHVCLNTYLFCLSTAAFALRFRWPCAHCDVVLSNMIHTPNAF